MTDIRAKYFCWLYDRVCGEAISSEYSYVSLCSFMHTVPFKVLVANDDNRAADGLELRNEFIFVTKVFFNSQSLIDLMNAEASVFEVLAGLAKRANFMIEMNEIAWFHIFLHNLRLDRFDDSVWKIIDDLRIRRIVRKFNYRTYLPNGNGGLFPLREPDEDQRKVELWYQMAAWMTENQMY